MEPCIRKVTRPSVITAPCKPAIARASPKKNVRAQPPSVRTTKRKLFHHPSSRNADEVRQQDADVLARALVPALPELPKKAILIPAQSSRKRAGGRYNCSYIMKKGPRKGEECGRGTNKELCCRHLPAKKETPSVPSLEPVKPGNILQPQLSLQDLLSRIGPRRESMLIRRIQGRPPVSHVKSVVNSKAGEELAILPPVAADHRPTGKQKRVHFKSPVADSKNLSSCPAAQHRSRTEIIKRRIQKLQPCLNYKLERYEGEDAILRRKRKLFRTPLPKGLGRPPANGRWYLYLRQKGGDAKWIKLL